MLDAGCKDLHMWKTFLSHLLSLSRDLRDAPQKLSTRQGQEPAPLSCTVECWDGFGMIFQTLHPRPRICHWYQCRVNPGTQVLTPVRATPSWIRSRGGQRCRPSEHAGLAPTW